MKFKIISSHKLGLGKKPRGSLSHHFHKKLKNNLFPNRRDICKELFFSWFFLFFFFTESTDTNLWYLQFPHGCIAFTYAAR